MSLEEWVASGTTARAQRLAADSEHIYTHKLCPSRLAIVADRTTGTKSWSRNVRRCGTGLALDRTRNHRLQQLTTPALTRERVLRVCSDNVRGTVAPGRVPIVE